MQVNEAPTGPGASFPQIRLLEALPWVAPHEHLVTGLFGTISE